METQVKLEHRIIFMVVPVLVLPGIIGIDGVWMSVPAGEIMSIMMGVYYFIKYHDIWKKPEHGDAGSKGKVFH